MKGSLVSFQYRVLWVVVVVVWVLPLLLPKRRRMIMMKM